MANLTYEEYLKSKYPIAYWRLGNYLSDKFGTSVTDDFTGADTSLPSPYKWTLTNTASMQISSNKLEFDNNPAANPGATTTYTLNGDFDTQIDYDVSGTTSTLETGYIAFNLYDGADYYRIIYYCNAATRRIAVTTYISASSVVRATDNGIFSIGKMRVKRVGTTIEFYYWDTDWVLLYTLISATTNALWPKLQLGEYTSNPNIVVNWDNYSATADSLNTIVAFEESGVYDGATVSAPTFGVDGLLVGATDTAVTFTNVLGQRINCGTSVGNQGIRTIAFSFKLTSEFSSANTIYQALLYRYEAADTDNFGVILDPVTGKLQFQRNVGVTPYSISSNATKWLAGVTYHVVATIHPTNGMELYIDGQKQTDTDATTSAVQSENQETAIGSWGSYTGQNRTLDGTVDDVVLLGQEFIQAEVTDAYTLSKGGGITKPEFLEYVETLSPTRHYRLGESVGTVAYDVSGNNSHGTHTNSPTLGTAGLITNDTDTCATYLLASSTYTHCPAVTGLLGAINVTFSLSSLVTTQYIISASDEAVATKFFGLRVDTDGSLRIYHTDGVTPSQVRAHRFLVTGKTYNVTIQSNGSAYEIYINGLKQELTVITGTNTGNWFDDVTGVDSLIIGGLYRSDGYTLGASANIDEVLVFSGDLLQEQNEGLYLRSIGNPSSPVTYHDVLIDTMPVLYYEFGETGAATSVVDEISGINGTYVNTPNLDVAGFVVSDPDTAMYTNGTNEWANLAVALPTLEQYSTGSISFITSFPAGGACEITFGDASDDTTFVLFYMNESRIEFLYKYAGAAVGVDNFARTNDGPFLADKPYHVVFVQDDTEGALIYVDGVKLTTYTRQGTPGARWWAEAKALVDTCAVNSLQRVTDAWYESTVDRLAFHNYRLTPADVTRIFKAARVTSIKVVIDHTKIDEALHNFPLLVNLDTNSGTGNFDTTSMFDSLLFKNHVVDILGDASCITYCDFDGDVLDVAGNYNGTVFGTPTYVPSEYPYLDKSISNNSSDDYVMFNGLGTWFATRTAFTIHMSAKPGQAGGAGSEFTFCVSNTTHIPPEYRVAIKLYTTGVHFYINTTSVSLSHSASYDVDTLYRVTVTYDGSVVIMYVDGNPVARLAYSTAVGPCHANASLGRIPATNTPSNYSLHDYDTFRIFDKALSPYEVMQISTISAPKNLKAFYLESNLDRPDYVDDNFAGADNDTPNPYLWRVSHNTILDNGDPVVPDIQGSQLDFSVTTDIVNGFIESLYTFPGDFDIQVDFSIDSAPTNFNMYLVVTDTPKDALYQDNYSYIGRGGIGPYRSNFTGGTVVTGGTADLTGKFRIRRVGTVLDNMFWNGTSWTTLNTDTTFDGTNVKVRLFVNTHTANETLNCNFDNYKVNSGAVSWGLYDSISPGTEECNVEIDRWDYENKQAQLWIKVPYISKDQDTELVFEAVASNGDNPNLIGYTGESSAQEVWSSYTAVYHMTYDGKDSTVNEEHGILKGINETNIADFGIGKGLVFDGATDWIDLGTGLLFDTGTTEDIFLEQTLKIDTGSSTWRGFQNRGTGGGGTAEGFQFSGTATQLSNIYVDNGDATNYSAIGAVGGPSITVEVPFNVTMVFKHNDGEINIYKDGVLVADDTDCTITGIMYSTAITSPRNATIGCAWDGAATQSQYLDGLAKETRFAKELKSDAWIKANDESISDSLASFVAAVESVNASAGIYINATTQALVLTEHPATVANDTDTYIQASSQALVLAAHKATVRLIIQAAHRVIYSGRVSADNQAKYAPSILNANKAEYAIPGPIQPASHEALYSIKDTARVIADNAAVYKNSVTAHNKSEYAVLGKVVADNKALYADAFKVVAQNLAKYAIDSVAKVISANAALYTIQQDLDSTLLAAEDANLTYATSGSTDTQLSGATNAIAGEGGVPTTASGGFSGLSPLASNAVTKKADVLSVDISTDEGAYIWQARVVLANIPDYASIQIGDEVVLTLGDDDYVLVVDHKTLNRQGPVARDATITAVSPAVRLTNTQVTPYTYTWDYSKMVSEIASEVAGMANISITWDTEDWLLPAGLLSITEGEPIRLLLTLAEAVGATLESNPDGSLVVRPSYVLSPKDYAEGVEDQVYTDEEHKLSASETQDPRRHYNSLEIGDSSPFEFADRIEFIADENDPTKGELRVYLFPWRSEVNLINNTDVSEVEYIGEVIEDVTDEYLEIVEGEGTVSTPIYSLNQVNVTWHSPSLGDLDFTQYDTQITSNSSGYGLISLTYKTRYLFYKVTGANLGDYTQYLLEDLGS